jgi:4'-phosphopantetheinyl transferase EntD
MVRELDACAAALAERLGPAVLCEVVTLDVHHGGFDDVWSEEAELMWGAVASRRREFLAGRACAHRLLARLGFRPAPLLRAVDRSATWPEGAVGSIAHHANLCVVAVARATRLRGLGLDIEPDLPLEEELWPAICTPRELGSLSACPPGARGRTARILFSAKESVYKCLPAPDRVALGFQDVEVDLDRASARFRARSPRATLQGFVLARERSIFTGIARRAAAEVTAGVH